MFLLQFLVVCYLFCGITGAPISKTKYTQIPSAKVLNFMKQFGYIEEGTGDAEALYTENGISEIIKVVQRYGAIEETGKIDNATLKLMSSPRCGVPDVIRSKRHKRYAFGSKGWQKRNLTYYIANWSPRLGEGKIIKIIQEALNTWGGYGGLSFRRAPNNDADIIVAFGTGYHGDQFPFDGSGNVLAHAFFPTEGSELGGDIHFDADEDWVDKKEGNSEEGIDFYGVALHELGHSLGLAHSTVPNSVMFPYYKDYDTTSPYQLDYDDILGMYNLYIKTALGYANSESTEDRSETTPRPSTSSTTYKTTFTSTTEVYTHRSVTPSVTIRSDTSVTYEGDDETVDDHLKHDRKHTVPNVNSPSLPNICDGFVDAMTRFRNELFVFKGQYVWRYKDKRRLQNGYPVTIYEMFSHLPKTIKTIDTAYEREDGNLVLFTGKEFWVYDGHQFIENSPKPLIRYGLPEYLENIDTVQTWGKNKKTYFFKNDRFWRYNETSKTMDEGYPLHVERWRGVPENLNAATTWTDGATYFFKGELFWKFDNNWVIVTDESPLPTAQIWFGCPEEEQKMIRLFH